MTQKRGVAYTPRAPVGYGARLRFGFIAVTVACTALLFWGLVTFVKASAQEELRQDVSPLTTAAPLLIALLLFVILGAIMISSLVVQGVRYVARRATNTTPVASEELEVSGRPFTKRLVYPWAKIRQLRSNVELLAVVRYAGALFAVFYLVLLITFLYGKYLIWPLIDNINSISRSQSILDALYVYLIIAGGIISGVLLYKGLFSPEEEATEEDLLSAQERLNLGELFWKTTRLRPTWRWVAWSLTGAYVFSVIVGSLIAYLEEPPLPQVQVVKEGNVIQPEASASTDEPGFQSSTKSLLAHREGYWYLLNEDDGNLVVVPDQSSNIIRMPRYVEVIDERRSIKVEVPSEWGEQLSDYPFVWREEPGFKPAQSSRLTISSNVDNWGRDYVTPGTFIEVYSDEQWSKWWGEPVSDDTVNEISIAEQETHTEYCGRPDEGPAVYDLEDEKRLYTAKVLRWHDCEGGGYFTSVWAVPKDQSFLLNAHVQLPKDEGTDYDAETDRILRSIEVRSDLLP